MQLIRNSAQPMAQVARDLGVADHLLYCWWVEQQQTETQACWDYRLQQEFITPSTPEQNGIIERFFRSLKEECVWQHAFQTFEEARRVIRDWLRWHNEERPYQALSYRSPVQYRAQQVTQVA